MQSAAEDRLYSDPDLAQFYDLDNGWDAGLDYCFGLTQEATSVLDLGCGTGLFLSRVAGRRRLAGVDPAAAMLAMARERSGSEGVTWIEADTRTLRLDERFDLVVLTGHAFQVFLTRTDRLAALATIAAHLAPGGRFIFDSRNPAVQEWRDWSPERSRRTIDHPRLGLVEAWNEASLEATGVIVTYRTHYRVTSSGKCLSAGSRIAFTPKEEIAALLDEAGLAVDRWLGDWSGAPYVSAAPEIIPMGHLR